MKKILSLMFAALIFIGCSSANSDKNETQALRIGTEGTYSPFTYHDNSGKLVGYDVEVIEEAAKRAGFKPEFYETNWDAIFSGLNSNRFDMIANQISDNNPKRAELYTLSNPYIVTSAAVAVRADNDTIKSLKDINGTKIAQAIGSAYYDTAVENGANIILVDNLAPAIKAVSQGRADGTMNDKLAILNYLKTTNDANVKIAFTTGEGTKSVFLFKKELTDARDKINIALDEMKKDGTLKNISEKYFGIDVSE
ncbi:amino acid ABC transporter substrate-binding protein [Campylobacter fetus subsp. testudinum]|uniref:transporter substrate-binding domain-containing protein n=1 Tax=Campylobacter fetus TaxID=196 RepID=UPI0008187941|nr:transporter substrate-binding domain-containing protein [Campylobacter fetus]AVK81045.1 amino acid ABC transporter substrate-binding protein [Campylobacter fetus subsp. testudinum]MPB71999.1 transporter substrate-binding domain-containing protein [Campylobacter fetus]MPB77544.1 transporter substrate-binding domain-containing protein [Campylobacter fetus]OCR89758.1 amino acid ABC transporter substrate-binding protein [Campylobacter fetus subsp. testudinum]OCR98703.1 amino acid ABC transporte